MSYKLYISLLSCSFQTNVESIKILSKKNTCFYAGDGKQLSSPGYIERILCQSPRTGFLEGYKQLDSTKPIVP